MIALGQRETDNIARMITIAGFICIIYYINVKFPNLDLKRERGGGRERQRERKRDKERKRNKQRKRDRQRQRKSE